MVLAVPQFWLNTYGHQAYTVAGLTIWNSLCDDLQDPNLNIATF